MKLYSVPWFKKATVSALPEPVPEITVVPLGDVFGCDPEKLPLSYVVRKIETDFIDYLDGRNRETKKKNILIGYGISKLGKSSLLTHVLATRPHIAVGCNRGIKAIHLYRELLHNAGLVEMDAHEIGAGVGGEAGCSVFKATAKVEGKVVEKHLRTNLANPSEVAEALRGATPTRIIVLDNFHYLDSDVQRALATASRTFADKGFKLVIIGTWSRDRYLSQFNADLQLRMQEFPFKDWERLDLLGVLDAGAPLLRITLATRVKQSLVARCASNIAMLQELTHSYIASFGITETRRQWETLSDVARVEEIESELVNELEKDVLGYLEKVASIGQVPILARPASYWILRTFLEHPEVMAGVNVDDLFVRTNDTIAANATAKASQTDLSKPYFMQLIKTHWHNVQVQQFQTPIILFNEVTDSLMVSDSCTKFVLRNPARRTAMVERLAQMR